MACAITRRLVLAAAATTLLSSLAGVPAVAAEEPEGAVLGLFEVIATRQLNDLDGLVCEEQQEAVVAAFGDAALGIDLMTQSLGAMSVAVEEPTIEVSERNDATASARVTARLVIDVDDERMRAFVREILETGAGPDDPPVTDQDVDMAVPTMADALALDQPIESVVSLVLEDGRWVVCGGLDAGFDELDDAPDPLVSRDGVCALATPRELSALGALEYDLSTSLDEFCTYSPSDWDAFHTATVSVSFGSTLEDWREAYPPEEELDVADAPAFRSGQSVFTEAAQGVLQVSVLLPEGDLSQEVDAVEQGVRISELFLPRLDELSAAGVGRDTATDPTPGPSLCDGIRLTDLNGISGRGFDSAEGDPWVCTWSSSDDAAGLDTIVAVVTDLTLDEFSDILGREADGAIEGAKVISTATRAIIELTGGRTLDVSVDYDEGLPPVLPADVLALTMVEWLAPAVPPEP